MRTHTGPPFPTPSIDEIRAWPQDTPERLEAKRAAARDWIRAFCARARFVTGASNLRLVSGHQKASLDREVDKAGSLLSAAEIKAALEGP